MPGSEAGKPTSPNYPSLPQLHLAKESRAPGVERRLGSSLLPDGISVASAGTVPGLCIRVWPRPEKRSKLDRLVRTLTLTLRYIPINAEFYADFKNV